MKKIPFLALSALFFASASGLSAQTIEELPLASELADSLSKPALTISGYVDTYYQYNLNRPASGVNGGRIFDLPHERESMNVLSLVLVIVLFFPGVNHLIKPGEARPGEARPGKAPAEKVRFEEFVAVEEMGKNALLRNAMNFVARVQLVSNTSDKVQVQYKEGVVRKAGSFYVYKKGLFTPQIHGEVKYNLQLEVGEEGYRYTYSDFVFQYYEKNRYGRYAPVSGKKKPLEEEKFAGMQEIWEEHKQTTRRHIENHIRALKAHMAVVPPGAHLDSTGSQLEELN